MTYIEWNFVYSSANFPRTREHGAPERAPRKLEAPQSSMEPLNRREPDDYRFYINTIFATVHFPETRLHGRLELE